MTRTLAISAWVGLWVVFGYAYGMNRSTEARFDSLQADINLLNADVQALDYLRKPAPIDDPIAPRTEYFI